MRSWWVMVGIWCDDLNGLDEGDVVALEKDLAWGLR